MSSRTKPCPSCNELRAQLDAAEQRARDLAQTVESLRSQLAEAMSLAELQRADLDRYRKLYEGVRPNTPERVPKEQLQLAFEQVLASMSEHPAAQQLANQAANDEGKNEEPSQRAKKPGGKKGRHPHGRQRLDLTNLPVEEIVIDPSEVIAADGAGFEHVADEVSDRVGFRPSTYVRLRIVRRKWARVGASDETSPDGSDEADASAPIVIASMPESVWPGFMADPSAVAANIISKYDDCLPLHRQERISARNGFRVPRSTQCSWLGEAYKVLYRIVDAMFRESVATAFCIATDATGAPVLAPGGCAKWHIFVFIADRMHIVFRYSEQHTSEAIQAMLAGFHGYLLSDAAPIYDALHRDGAIEVDCWFHLRRYFWRGLETDPQRALEAMSLIAKLFEIERDCRTLPMPQRTDARAERARPVLALIDEWVERNKGQVDPRGPLDRAIGYYTNQREGLHRFLEDGRLRLDNSISEQQLRNAVLGRHNWLYFANETGLKWYTTFRSLIASCALHGINAHEYLEQVLRLAPHWPVSRVLELSPRYWRSTLDKLDDRQKRILTPPWQNDWPLVDDKSRAAAEPVRIPA
jgi:transposase